MTYFLPTGSFRSNNGQRRTRRRLTAAAMRGCQVNALNGAARQRAKTPGVSFAFFAARVRDRRQIRSTTAREMLQEQRGATAIEMALCLPVLLLLIVGLLQLGTVMLMQSLFHTAMKDVVNAVLDEENHADTEKAFCNALGGRVQLLNCKSGAAASTKYAIDVRSSVDNDGFGKAIPSTLAFEGIDSTTADGSIRFIRAYMEIPVFWSAFTPVFATGNSIPLYAGTAIVHPSDRR